MSESFKLNIIENDKDLFASGKDILPLIENLKAPIGIEIGVDAGDTSYYFLKNKNDLTLIGVDPYVGYKDWNDNNLDQSGRDNVYNVMTNKLKEFGSRWILNKMTSDEALGLFIHNEYYDFIFIDGLHTYEQVLKDCRNYYPKIKKGGVFSGHDYKVISGVNKAVNEFAAEVGAKPIHLPNHDAWYWIKT